AQVRADATTMLAVARGVGAELVVLERQREARLRHFHAAELDPARGLPLPRGLPAVADGGGAAAWTRVEHVPDERALGARFDALDRDAEAPAPARDDAVGTRRRERLDDRLHDLLRAVVGGGGHRR